MKTVKTYLYSHEAHLDLAKLQDENIEAFIKDDNIVSIDPVLAHAVGGIKLIVNDEDLQKALEILQENDYEYLEAEFSDDNLEEQNKCPNCKSINIYQKHSWWSAIIFYLFSGAPVSIRKSTYRCLDCSFQWKE